MPGEPEPKSGFLLVPMSVEALLVGQQDRDDLTWSNLSPRFDRMKYGPFGPKLVQVLEEKGAKGSWQPKTGVHLHWALPRALARAEYGDQASAKGYPAVPNRWLVHRVLRRPEETPEIRAWLIESDAVDAAAEAAADREPAVVIPNLDPGAKKLHSTLGRCVELGAVESPHRLESESPLTALGWGSPVFSAYYPACKGVLGFHDPSPAGSQDGPAMLTYQVVGWYSDSSQDPLGQCADVAQCEEKLDDLGWSCGGPLETFLPNRTACHGAVMDIGWRGQGDCYASQVLRQGDDGKSYQIAVGNSSAEALSKLLSDRLEGGKSKSGAKKAEQEVLLEAFQHGILGDDHAVARLSEGLHLRRFAAVSGGLGYAIQQRRGSASPSRPPQAVEIPSGIALQLHKLNQAADKTETTRRRLDATRHALYAEWCRWTRRYLRVIRKAPEWPTRDALTTEIARQVAQLAADEGDVAQRHQKLVEALAARCPEYELVESDLPPFYRPNNPAILVAGPGLEPRGRYRPTSGIKKLACRVAAPSAVSETEATQAGERPDEIVEALVVDISNWRGIEVSATADWAIGFETAVPRSAVGPVARRLLAELLILDPANAAVAAELAYARKKLTLDRDSEEFSALASAIKQLLDKVRVSPRGPFEREAPRLKGTAPARLAMTRWRGENPWLPLLVAWRAEWTSDYPGATGAWEPDQWSLDRSTEEFEPPETLSEQASTSFKGWTMLSPQAPWLLRERLKEYRRDHPEADVNELIAMLSNIGVLSQSLGGFNEALRQLESGLQLPPINPDFLTRKAGAAKADAVSDLLTGIDLVLPDPGKPFFPVRSGAFEVKTLWIVDAFGQTLRLASKTLGQPVRPRLVADENPARMVLAPRIAQGARLRFEFEPPAEAGPAGNPVFGWVVPNHLDKSLTLYDPKGKLLGALQKTLRDGGRDRGRSAFFWVPVPGDPAGAGFYQELAAGRSGPVPDIPKGPLADFVRFLLTRDAGAGRMFHSLVDGFLSSKHAGRPEDDPLLSILVGRPLALVRARIKLELDGPPARNQKEPWEEAETEAPAFTKIPFPLRLGDRADPNDGLVGSFDDAMTVFFPTAKSTGEHIDGIQFDEPWTVTAAKPTTVTLLVDPQREVAARTGILPVKRAGLPSSVATAMARIEATFFLAAPVLGTGEAPAMPVPSDDFGEWSWAVRPDVGFWRPSSEIAAATDRAGFTHDPQGLTEGWLYLRMNPVVILAFGLKEKVTEVAPGAEVTLTWKVQGADTITLGKEGEVEPIATWQRPELTREHALSIHETTTFALTAADLHGNRRTKTIVIQTKQS